MKTLTPLKAGLFAILASTAVLATTVTAQANDGMEMHPKGDRMARHDGMHHMLRGLELTDAQKAEIKKLFEQHKASRKEERPADEVRAAHKAEMLALVSAEQFDEAQAKQFVAAQQDRHQANMLERLKMQNEIYNLLTPEQQSQFKARFEQERKEPRG